MALEGGELIIRGVVVGALIEDVAQRGGEFQSFVELVDYLCIKQEHIFELTRGKFVAIVFTTDVPFPFAVGHDVE